MLRVLTFLVEMLILVTFLMRLNNERLKFLEAPLQTIGRDCRPCTPEPRVASPADRYARKYETETHETEKKDDSASVLLFFGFM